MNISKTSLVLSQDGVAPATEDASTVHPGSSFVPETPSDSKATPEEAADMDQLLLPPPDITDDDLFESDGSHGNTPPESDAESDGMDG